MQNNPGYTGLEIAIIGMSCRFPGAKDWREYWNNLSMGKESIQFLSPEELQQLGVDLQMAQRNDYVPVRTLFENKDSFDSSFFDYRPSEARLMNPVHRIFHECLWEALEDAGYNPEKTKGPIGVFTGARDDLNWKVYSVLKNKNEEIDDFTLHHINNRDFLATLLSYKLNLQGPAFTVNTGCSTSLVALNLACKSLLLGETKMALAGGASIETRIQKGYLYQEGMINSADGHCRAFDKDSSGTTLGEGAGIVVLKKLSDAIQDRDHIYAVIKGSAVNNDGNRKVGFTAPSVDGQAECIKKAHRFSKVDPESIDYIETHGTGTKLGDVIEAEALKSVFSTRKNGVVAIGSVKTNIGHLDAAAGIAGLIKTALSLKYKQIPPSLHYNLPNPDIDFEKGKIYVINKLTEWASQGNHPRRAGVSSFGIGGTNAHVILEEAPVDIPGNDAVSSGILALSAKTEGSIVRYATKLKEHINNQKAVSLSDISYTLLVGRKHFEYRCSILYRDRDELLHLLEEKNLRKIISRSKARIIPVIFMFSGAGSQYVNMGRALYQQNVAFRSQLDTGFALLKKSTGYRYEDILFSNDNDQLINKMLHTQPMIFLFGYSLARVLMSVGIVPQYMIGHSIGEYIAACLSGVFTFEDALKLVVRRGELMDQMPAGSMISVSISQQDASKYLDDKIALASINGPEQVVFSGEVAAIEELSRKLNVDDISFVKLHASQAGHSSMIDQIMEEYASELRTVEMNAPQISFVSNLTGQMIKNEQAQSVNYWVQHMRETVKFSDGIKLLQSIVEGGVFLEIGGGHSLSTLVRQHANGKAIPVAINTIRHPKEKEDDHRFLLDRLGKLWTMGINIDWISYYKNDNRKRIPLPTYSFEPIKYPTEVDPFKDEVFPALSGFKSANNELKDWVYYPVWKSAPLIPELAKENKECVFLFFSLDNSFSQKIRIELLQRGHRAIEVLIGNQFQKINEDRYLVNPYDTNELKKLIVHFSNDAPVTDIIYEWGISERLGDINLGGQERKLSLLYLTIANIVKQFLNVKALSNKRFFLLTSGLHVVSKEEGAFQNQALMLGFVNVLPQEYSVTCRNIDYECSDQNISHASELVTEILNSEYADRIVALRSGQRWTRSYQKNTSTIEPVSSPIKKNHLYLITGGLGNVGFLFAQHILEKKDAKVVLLGRRDPNNHTDQPEISTRLSRLLTISKNVSYYKADVSDLKNFEEIITEIESVHGAISGVIHASGVMDKQYFDLIEDISEAKAKMIFEPKILGIQNLYKVFGERNMDFVWITSSLASVLGGLSYSCYSAANLYMEHFISLHAQKLPSWKCVGLSEMFFLEQEPQPATEPRKGLNPSEIIKLLEWSIPLRHLPVMYETTIDLESRLHQIYNVKKQIYLDDTVDATIDAKERPDLINEYQAPKNSMEEKLVNIFEVFFGVKGIGIDDNFFELGGDSLKGMMLLKKIKNEFEVYIPLSAFFQGQTIRQICVVINEVKNISVINDKKTSRLRI